MQLPYDHDGPRKTKQNKTNKQGGQQNNTIQEDIEHQVKLYLNLNYIVKIKSRLSKYIFIPYSPGDKCVHQKLSKYFGVV